jgi:hypothetical protein
MCIPAETNRVVQVKYTNQVDPHGSTNMFLLIQNSRSGIVCFWFRIRAAVSYQLLLP